MAKTREIKGRIKAVTNIQRITKTMQMIATARFQAAQRRATASQPYTPKIAALVAELAATAGTLTHPLLQPPEPRIGKELLLVLSSNRGLAGAYNGNVLRTAMGYLRQHTDRQIDVEAVGKKAAGFFKFAHVPVAAFHSQFTDKPTYDQVDQLAERYMKLFAAKHYDAVRVVYMAYQSMARQSPAVLTLLPLRKPGSEEKGEGRREKGASEGKLETRNPKPETAAVAEVQYDFSPGATELLNDLLPVTVKAQLFQAFNEAVVGEQIARMVAMKAATDAAGKMKKTLTRRFNRARQTAITTELSEIIGGAAGLE